MRQKVISLLLIIMIGIQSFGLVFAEDLSEESPVQIDVFYRVDSPCGINFNIPSNAEAYTVNYKEMTESGDIINTESKSVGKKDFSIYYDSDIDAYQYLTSSTYEDYYHHHVWSISFTISFYDGNHKIISIQSIRPENITQVDEGSFEAYAGESRSKDMYIYFQDTKVAKLIFPDALKGAHLSQEGGILEIGDLIQKSTTDYMNPHFIYFSDLPTDLKIGDSYDITLFFERDNNIDINLIKLNIIKKPDATNPPQNSPTPTPPQSTPRVTIPEVTTDVIVNGDSMSVGYGSYFNNNVGESMAKIKLDTDKVIDKIDKENLAEVSVSFTGHKDHYQSEMNVALIDDFASKGGQFTMKTSASDYLLPMSALSMEDMMTDIPDYVGLEDVSVFVEVKEPDKDMQQKIDNHFNLPGESEDKYKDTSLDKKELLVNPVSYNVYTIYNGKANDIDLFKQFVTRLIPLEKDMDESQMTTAIVIRSNGTYYSVPSKVIEKDGKKYLEIKSLTNGIYSALENKVTVTDMAGHWAREAVKHLGSRMILDIQPDGAFYPNALTPSNDFSEALMRTMGLDTSEDWQETMSQLKLGDKSLLNQDTISREQAMTLMANALATTSDYKALTDEEVKNILSDYADGSSISAGNQEAVATCIEYQLISGDANHHLLPQGQVTNAQIAVMLDQLLSQL